MELAPTELTATINPDSNNLELELGVEQREVVTVTIPASIGVNKADVYLLADTTGSMGSIITAVKDGANAIVGAPYNGVDIAFGVGNYRDLPETNPPFIHQCEPTTDKTKVTDGIQGWGVEGGGDFPEGQLYALHKLAEEPGGATINWRDESKRIIVWFGDAPGHDPICKAISGLDVDITEESVRASLIEQGITVIAISVNGNRLDANPALSSVDYLSKCERGGKAGQATRIASETGGKHVTGINPDEIVQTIIDLIDTAIRDIGEVKLVPTPDVAPFVQSVSPSSFKDLPGELEHVLEFSVRCAGVEPCIDEVALHTGALNAVADGAVIASQSVQVTVPACDPLRVIHFVLVNADTNEDIRVLGDDDVLDMNVLPENLNVRVVTGDAVECITFTLVPHNEAFKGEENMRPFSLFGDVAVNNFNAGQFENGSHTITATPFSQHNAQGDQGETVAVTFEVING